MIGWLLLIIIGIGGALYESGQKATEKKEEKKETPKGDQPQS